MHHSKLFLLTKPAFKKIILLEPNLLGFYQSLIHLKEEKYSTATVLAFPVKAEIYPTPVPYSHPVPSNEVKKEQTEKHLWSSRPNSTDSIKIWNLIIGLQSNSPTSHFTTTSLKAYWLQFLVSSTSCPPFKEKLQGISKCKNTVWRDRATWEPDTNTVVMLELSHHEFKRSMINKQRNLVEVDNIQNLIDNVSREMRILKTNIKNARVYKKYHCNRNEKYLWQAY